MKLPGGGKLPSGLVDFDIASVMGAFNKTYNNFALRAGIVLKVYPVESDLNRSKLAPEYDVVVMEQDANRAVTPITYKNCIAANAFGSIADYFETRLRTQKKTKNKESLGRDFVGQDGAIVLMLCLDGSSEKAIIIGGVNHPNRTSKLVGEGQILAGEFNGMSIKVEDDGSANLTFKGATDNEGKPKDSSQGNTTIDIEKDGSIQIKNKGVSQRMEKQGNFTVENSGKTSITTKKDVSVKSSDKISIESKADTSMKMSKFLLDAQGSASMKAQSFMMTGQTMFDIKAQMINATAAGQAMITAPIIAMNGIVSLGGPGGLPLAQVTTQAVGIGNLGIPGVSCFVGPCTQSTPAL